ncbi:hypothetical protein [Herbidospora daliensis]|uniref:hypothetical protein n=1 Tax=Herbidospora daliensis TaxID=295585 RepID=UPI000A4EB015|nr:hypothetical protein [Herbidospora daliensis]
MNPPVNPLVKHEEKEIPLSLTLGELNVVLEALGNLPYVRVYELIGKLHEQASSVLSPKEPE